MSQNMELRMYEVDGYHIWAEDVYEAYQLYLQILKNKIWVH
jgi:hypothetical protein